MLLYPYYFAVRHLYLEKSTAGVQNNPLVASIEYLISILFAYEPFGDS